jgi:hypothetical protein
MPNKKISQETNNPNISNSGLLRYAMNGANWSISWGQILTALGLSNNSVFNITPATINYLQLYNITLQNKITIDCYFVRGDRCRTQQLQIMSCNTSDLKDIVLLEGGYKTIPKNSTETVGLTFSVQIIADIATLLITADDSDITITQMFYKTTFNG